MKQTIFNLVIAIFVFGLVLINAVNPMLQRADSDVKESVSDTVSTSVSTSVDSKKVEPEWFHCATVDDEFYSHAVGKYMSYHEEEHIVMDAVYLEGVLRGELQIYKKGIHKTRKPKRIKEGSSVRIRAVSPTKDCDKFGCTSITIKESHTTVSVWYWGSIPETRNISPSHDTLSNTKEYPFSIWNFPYETGTYINTFYMPLSETELNLIRTKDKQGRDCLKIYPSLPEL